MRRLLLAAGLALAVVAPAAAVSGKPARLSGRYRVTYTKLSGDAVGAGTNRFRWSAFPTCASGPCTTQVRSLYPDGTLSARLTFAYDGATYTLTERVPRAERCVDSTGKQPPVAGAYDVTLVTRFRVEKASASGRALAFSGTYSVRFLPNAAGRAHGCAYVTGIERLVGRAITAS